MAASPRRAAAWLVLRPPRSTGPLTCSADPLASGAMTVRVIHAETLGDAWLEVSRAALESGVPASWGGLETRELPTLTIEVAHPATADAVIAELGDPAWLAWMHENFFVRKDVVELGNARSYACRLFDYAGAGRDQLAWVVARLAADPTCRDATI